MLFSFFLKSSVNVSSQGNNFSNEKIITKSGFYVCMCFNWVFLGVQSLPQVEIFNSFDLTKLIKEFGKVRFYWWSLNHG